jgi:hypothetical protein
VPSWSAIVEEVPELAEEAIRFFAAGRHKTLATLRRDGSPRISGTEVDLRDGELWLGCMYRSVKALDLRRDSRFALHSASIDPPAWSGDAKVAGIAEEVTDPALIAAVNGPDQPRSHLFRLDVIEVVVVRVGEPADHLVIKSWHTGRGVTEQVRR